MNVNHFTVQIGILMYRNDQTLTCGLVGVAFILFRIWSHLNILAVNTSNMTSVAGRQSVWWIRIKNLSRLLPWPFSARPSQSIRVANARSVSHPARCPSPPTARTSPRAAPAPNTARARTNRAAAAKTPRCVCVKFSYFERKLINNSVDSFTEILFVLEMISFL